MARDGERAAAGTRQITQDDLRWLACPVCRNSLRLEQTQGADSHPIECNGCKRRFPVIDGLPVLLEARSVIET
jgi:uncharacterized protein YbaR (Trm112 family)